MLGSRCPRNIRWVDISKGVQDGRRLWQILSWSSAAKEGKCRRGRRTAPNTKIRACPAAISSLGVKLSGVGEIDGRVAPARFGYRAYGVHLNAAAGSPTNRDNRTTLHRESPV